MKSEIIIGDLFNTDCEVIAHQVNCIGVMGSGIAKTIREKYPETFNKYKLSINLLDHNCLGGCLLIKENKTYIANIFGQFSYKGNEDYYLDKYRSPALNPDPKDTYFSIYTGLRYTNYEAFYNALIKLRTDMNRNELNSIAFPYKIGCDRGGGSWRVIESMIDDVFENTNIKVKIYKLN